MLFFISSNNASICFKNWRSFTIFPCMFFKACSLYIALDCFVRLRLPRNDDCYFLLPMLAMTAKRGVARYVSTTAAMATEENVACNISARARLMRRFPVGADANRHE